MLRECHDLGNWIVSCFGGEIHSEEKFYEAELTYEGGPYAAPRVSGQPKVIRSLGNRRKRSSQ